MAGFTESLNISVCAAISMNILLSRIKSEGISLGLSEREKEILRIEWYRKCVRGSDIIERAFESKYEPAPV
jgi:tRNA (guanosine-2'-O-)-methyltransferase